MTEKPQHQLLVTKETCLAGCSCGRKHPVPEVTLCFDEKSCQIMAEDVAQLFPDGRVLVISDPETDSVCGAKLRQLLAENGVSVRHKLLDSKPHATDTLCAEVEAACKDQTLVISVGSGTVNDLGKFSATNQHLPFWTMPTAPSMNGYTSGIAAIEVKGVKRTLPAIPPERIYAVPSVVRAAPVKLRQSGFCDVMAKVVSDIDWRCESMLLSDSYCALPSVLLAEVESLYADCPEEIGRGEETAANGLFRGLLISGVAMSLAGSSAPASGGEHLLSHFLDMREPVTGRVPELHGLQVGMGILLSTACYRRLAQLEKDELPTAAEQIFLETAEEIPAIWGDLSEEVTAQFEGKKEILLSFNELVPKNWEKLRQLFQQVRPVEYFADLFNRVGTPFTLNAFRLDRDEFILAARNSRAIRNRITVLDFAAHARVLDAAIEDTLHLMDKE